MPKNPTISDIAKQAGVSKATVSAVINDKGTVSDTTREKVLTIINKLNYRPREFARHRLRPSINRTIGFIIKEDDNPYYSEVIAGARSFASDNGYEILVASSEGDYEAERRIIEVMTAKDVSGFIITPVQDRETDLSHLFDLKRRNIPFVLLEGVRGLRAHLIDIDNVEASEEAIRYLIGQGFPQILYFVGPAYSLHSEDRLEGVRRAFSMSNKALQPDQIVYAGAHAKGGYEAGLAYFKKHRPSQSIAVACYNDLVALGLLRALAELGICVPDEVSVMGFDDLDFLKYTTLSLSTVHVPKFEMGKKAVEILAKHIEAGETVPVEKVQLDYELVFRATTRQLLHINEEHS